MNSLISPEQMSKDVLASMESSGLSKALREASPSERQEMALELANFFGARFPVHSKA